VKKETGKYSIEEEKLPVNINDNAIKNPEVTTDS
jgi:hypothetical protein